MSDQTPTPPETPSDGHHGWSDVIHPTHSRTPWQAVRDMFSLRYHVRRLQEDLAATKSALELRKHLDTGNADREMLPAIFRGKLMGVFFATGWTNLIGIFLGGWLQYSNQNQWVGLFSTPALCYIVTAIGFQIGWFLDNRTIYRNAHPDPAHRFLELQKDMLPVHKAALPVAIVFSTANILIAGPILTLITLINPEAGKNTPAGALIMLVEFLFIGGSFVRLMGDFFDKYAYKLATKYAKVCTFSR